MSSSQFQLKINCLIGDEKFSCLFSLIFINEMQYDKKYLDICWMTVIRCVWVILMNEIWITRKRFEQEKYKCIVNPHLINGGQFLALLVISNEWTWFIVNKDNPIQITLDTDGIIFGTFVASFEAVASNSAEVSTFATLIMFRVGVTFARWLPNSLGRRSWMIPFEYHLTQMASHLLHLSLLLKLQPWMPLRFLPSQLWTCLGMVDTANQRLGTPQLPNTRAYQY